MKKLHARTAAVLATAGAILLMSAGGPANAAGAPNCAAPGQPRSDCPASAPQSDALITPYIIPGANSGGNRTCGDVGSAYFGDANYYKCYSDRINYGGGSFDGTFANISGNAQCSQTATVNTDGTEVSFTAAPHGLGAAIVKGSSDANTYVYDPQRASDGGLASPLNASGGSAELSNLTLCWNVSKPEVCLKQETAWACGLRYVQQGNWATFTSYAGVLRYTNLYAGQTMAAGKVKFSAPVDNQVTITITLNPGWQFAAIPGSTPGTFDNNIKVQGYFTAPRGNPAPGLFMYKVRATGRTGRITVPYLVDGRPYKYYGVHVDVAKEIPCE